MAKAQLKGATGSEFDGGVMSSYAACDVARYFGDDRPEEVVWELMFKSSA